MTHGHAGWELIEYERTGNVGRFVYERRLPGQRPVVVEFEREHSTWPPPWRVS